MNTERCPPTPHTHHLPLKGIWSRPCSKEQALFPLHALREVKYWPPVVNIDNVYGARHPICSCLPMESYSEAVQ